MKLAPGSSTLSAMAAVVLALAGSSPAGPATPAPGGTASPPTVLPASDPRAVVRRTTLIVHDVDASVRFYRDLLGFEVWLENTGKVSASSLPTDAPVGSTSRFVIMKGKHPWVGMIGLLQYGPSQPIPPAPAKLAPGDAVLMIETDDLDGAYARMRSAGTKILRPPETTEVTSAGGVRWTASFVFAFDPDGHIIELNQRRPAAGTTAAATQGAVEVRRAFADSRLGQLHYRRAEPRSAQGLHTPLVLLHQTPLSGRMFSEFLPQVAQQRVVYAPDTPGYGESAAPASQPTIEQYADALDDFVQTIGGPVDLLGYHTGAAMAVALARRHPEHVRRVILVSVPLLDEAQKARVSQPAATLPIRDDGSHLLDMWRSTMSVRPPGQSIEDAARIVAEKQRNVVNTEWALAALASYPLADELRQVKQPVLFVRPKDGLWEQSAAAAALLPKAAIIEHTDWAYGIFDANGAEIAAAIAPFLDAAP